MSAAAQAVRKMFSELLETTIMVWNTSCAENADFQFHLRENNTTKTSVFFIKLPVWKFKSASINFDYTDIFSDNSDS